MYSTLYYREGEHMKYWIILILIFALYSCSFKSEKSIQFPDYVKVKIKSQELTIEEVEDLRDIFSELEPIKKDVYDKPDIIILGYNSENDGNPDMYCVFKKDRYIFVGDYFEAWAQRMKGRKSNCYIINEDLKSFLEIY